MPAKFASAAAQDLKTYLSTALVAKLRQVETDESLAANALADPQGYALATHEADQRNPLVVVRFESGSYEDQANDTTANDCDVHLVFRSSDLDAEAMELKALRYVSALLLTIDADPTLGGRAYDAQPGEYDSGAELVEGALVGGCSIRVTVKRHET